MPPAPSRKHIPELDGVRGIAILAVLFYHVFFYTMARRPNWTGVAHFVSRATEDWARGVDLFFVLSGFLITGILLDTRAGPHYFSNFYARRALRILPVYYIVLLAILIFYPHPGPYVLLSFIHLSNLAPIFGITMANGAMWSLAVEEHFYLVWPFLVSKLARNKLVLLAFAICLAELIVRGLAFPHVKSVLAYTWFRLDALATGSLLACFLRAPSYTPRSAGKLAGLLAGAGALVEILGSPYGIRQHRNLFGAIFEFTTANVFFAGLVLWAVSASGSAATAFLRTRALRFLGALSYCLYLVHCMVMDAYDAALRALHQPPALVSFQGICLRAAAVLTASFFIAFLSREFLELPALRLKRFFPLA